MVTQLNNNDNTYDQDGGINPAPDTIEALGGDDMILTSTLGGSLVRGGTGNDKLLSRGFSTPGDTIYGGLGDDSLRFQGSSGLGFGDEGDDTLEATIGTSLYGGSGGDSLKSILERNWLQGNQGNDMFLIKFRDSIYGGKDNDTITDQTPTGGQNFIRGDIGQDSVYVRGDRDTIYGGKDNDTLISEGSRVYVRGDDGNDIVDNSQASPTDRSTLLGGEGNDSILGGLASSGTNSRNLLDGEAGNDTLFGQGAKDTLMGGEGDDSISIGTSSSGLNLLDGGAGEDTLLGGSSTDTINGGSGNDSLSGLFNRGDGGGGNDTIDVSQVGTSVPEINLIGGAGSDSLVGSTNSGVSNFFDGGTGNDFIQFGGSNDKLIGNTEGNDTITAAKVIDSTSSPFLIEDTLGSNTLSGHTGADILVTGAGDDSIVGGDKNDTGDDNIVAGAGNDIIFGRGGTDTILGGAGNDYIAPGINGTGDSLIGGEGDDSFVFFVADTSTRKSVIVDFNATDDRILLSDAGFGLANSKAGQVIRNADFIAIDPGENYNNNANSTNPTIIYEIRPVSYPTDTNSELADSGILKYDPNGNGGTAEDDGVVVIARLNGNPDINASDIFII